MAATPLLEDLGLEHLATDHTIAIPRPREAALIGKRDACSGCHSQGLEWINASLARWGAQKALQVRDSVEWVHRARSSDPEALDHLARLLEPGRSELDVVSALRFLLQQPTGSALPAAVERWTSHDSTEIRGTALTLLILNDDRQRNHWLSLARSQQSPLVRMMTFVASAERTIPGEDEKLQHLSDALAVSISPPVDTIMDLAQMRDEEGEFTEAFALSGLGLKYSRGAGHQRSMIDGFRIKLSEKWSAGAIWR